MSKQISQYELAHVFCRLLLDQSQFGTLTQFEEFMTEAAELVATHCGGVVSHKADTLDDQTYVAISSNEELPKNGGIWQAYDLEGDLHNRADYESQDDESILKGLSTYVIARNGDRSHVPDMDTLWQVYFPSHVESEDDDYLNCPEWIYLMAHASFTHTEVGDLIVHVGIGSNFDAAPDIIKNIINEASNMGMTWILFHLGQ